MKKTIRSLFWTFAAMAILGLGSCRSIQSENKNNQEPPDSHTTRISLSWDGSYRGYISSGGRMIDALLHLNSDDTFELSYSYKDIPDKVIFSNGKFNWDKTERNIILGVKDFPPYYWVVSNRLIQLDSKGKIIAGAKTGNYTLEKIEPGRTVCDF